MRLARFTLWLCGLGFVGFGLLFLVDPLGTLARIGISLEGALAAAEIRAFYGGFELAVGLLILAADRAARHRPYGLLLAAGTYGGVGLARALGMALGPVATPFLWAALLIELTLAALALLAWRGLRGADAD